MGTLSWTPRKSELGPKGQLDKHCGCSHTKGRSDGQHTYKHRWRVPLTTTCDPPDTFPEDQERDHPAAEARRQWANENEKVTLTALTRAALPRATLNPGTAQTAAGDESFRSLTKRRTQCRTSVIALVVLSTRQVTPLTYHRRSYRCHPPCHARGCSLAVHAFALGSAPKQG